MNNAITFNVKSLRFDENYNPSESTRITTNFANLARGEKRQDNLRNALTMIDNRFNALAHWDNPKSDRYAATMILASCCPSITKTVRDLARRITLATCTAIYLSGLLNQIATKRNLPKRRLSA